MQDVKCRPKIYRVGFLGWRANLVVISKQHEDIPHSKLGREGDGIIEQRQIPTCPVRCWYDAQVILAVTISIQMGFREEGDLLPILPQSRPVLANVSQR